MRSDLFMTRPTLWAIVAVVLWLMAPVMAAAGPVTALSPFASQTFNRTVHGDQRSLDLNVGGRQWGTAGAFFGVESRGAARRYLTSGLQWRSGALGVPVTRVALVRTETQGAQEGQIMAHARTELDLGEAWYLPDLTAEVARLAGGSGAWLGGGAVRFGLSKHLGSSDYNVGYFQSDPNFTALGSSIGAGQRGLELGARHQLGSDLVLAHHVRLRQNNAAGAPNVRHDLVLSHVPRFKELGTRWALNARFGHRGHGRRKRRAFSFELAARAGTWRDWRIDTAIGWYGAAANAPLGMPVAGAMWQFSATRHLDIAGFRTRVAPALALGGSAYDTDRLGLRTGLTMGFDRLSDHIDFKVNYRSAAWSGADANHGDLRMSVNYRQSTGGILAGLRAFVSKLRLPWQRP